jgi:CheY-like chemotaxis protein
MGGGINVESEYGKGSVFTALIPQIINPTEPFAAAKDEANKKSYIESSDGISFTIPDVRLLVVDDIDINLRVAEGLLTAYGATVDTCLSGAEAIETVKRNRYDLVFMDHIMPDVDGIEATAAIREWEAEQGTDRHAVPIVALTANAVVGMKEMFIEKGFNDFLSKPIDVSMLDKILERWIPQEKN